MSAKKIAGEVGGCLLGAAVFAVLFLVAAVFIFGAAWASSKLLPWFQTLADGAFVVTLVILLPLAIPRATRGFSSTAIFVVSYVFGVTLWMEGFLLTLAIWGVTAVVIGVLIAGVGVVPIAMLATLLKGMWSGLVELVLLTVLTFGSRAGAFYLAGSMEE